MPKRSTKTVIGLAIGLGFVGAAGGLWLSAPNPVEPNSLPPHVANLDNGRVLYTASGCISCHKPSDEAISAGAVAALPSGGAPLVTPVGTLFPPNITPDKQTGIGSWSEANFVSALQRGVSPKGAHYIPAFPYTSYARMSMADVRDIWAYIKSLPAVNAPEHGATLPLEPVLRRGIGLWKQMAIPKPFVADVSQSIEWNRGAYLVNGAGHCGECHTPRDIFMIGQASKAFEGGPHPDGTGQVPSLHNLIARKVFEDTADLATALREGEGGGYEHMSSGGMGEAQTNMSHLPEADVAAIATYLSSLK